MVALLASFALALPASAAVTDEAGPDQATQGLKGKACVAAARGWTDRAVTNRLIRISALRSALDQAAHVSAAHRAQLEAIYTADRSGLKAVRAEVRHDSTCAEARKDAKKVVTKFRVYRLLTPQTSLTIRGDHGVFRAEAYDALEPAYVAAIAALPAGADKVAAEAALTNLTTNADAALAAYGGVGDAVLALVPADIPGQVAVLAGAEADADAGRVALKNAAADRVALDAILS